MDIELLYFDGCPNAEEYVPRLRALIATTSHHLVEREILDEEQAVAESFLGSPTVRVDGRDVEPGAVERTDFGMSCRIYRTADGSRGTPPDEWVWRALGEGER
ncbi:DF family (seleno)protein [Actinomycetospora sp. CA-101289]|uniref:DF family (seleno)protein n=1 Tax=Actinomycetospora sp. CA-101289 TaxID=3239893 RepID=UPI003D97F1A5